MSVTRTVIPPAVLAVLLAAGCSSSEPALEKEALQEAGGGSASGEEGAPEPVYMDLVLDENTVDLAEGITYTLAGLERSVSSWDDTPYLGIDVTAANSSGEVFDPADVNIWVTTGPEGTEAEDVIDPDGGVGTDEGDGAASGPEFGATIPDGEEVTIRFGYALPAEEEKVEIRLQPWGLEGAPEVYLTGEIPR